MSLPSNIQYFLPAWDSTSQELKTLSSLTKRLVKEEKSQGRNLEKKVDSTETAMKSDSIDRTQRPEGLMQHAYPAGSFPGLRGGQRGRGLYRGRGVYHQRGGYHPYSFGNREQNSTNLRGGLQQSNITCFHCGEQGHIKGKCRLWLKVLENQKNWNPADSQQSYSYKSCTSFSTRK